MAVGVSRFAVYLVNLDSTIGVEIKKTRPCLIVSPDELNRRLRTCIIAPMTTRKRAYPSRVACRFQGKTGEIVLDQIRAVDQASLIKKLGEISGKTVAQVLNRLQEMFSP